LSIHRALKTRSVSSIITIIGVILVATNLRAPITSLGPVLGEIQNAFSLSPSALGGLNALPLLLFSVLSLIAPYLGKVFSLERVIACSLCLIMAGIVYRSSGWISGLWYGTIVLSFGIAFCNVLLPSLVKRDFPSRAGSITGFYAAAMAATAGLSAGISAPLSQVFSMQGWKWSLGIWALLAFLSLMIWLPQIKGIQHRLDLNKSKKNNESPQISPWKKGVGWQVSLFFAFHSFVFYAIVDWFPSYASTFGISSSTSGAYLMIYQVVAISTNLATVPLIRIFKNQMGIGFICGLLLFIGGMGLLFLPKISLLWMIVAGLGAGMSMVTSLSLFILRTNDYYQAAKLSGMAQCIGYLGAALGPLLIGILHDMTNEWFIPLMLIPAASILVMVFATLAGRSRVI